MLAPGDRVAVFTGRDHTTVANYGIVLAARVGSHLKSLVFLPHLNSYCLADDESLLRFERGKTDRFPFAEVVINHCDSDHCDGTYRQIGTTKNTFEFIQSSEGRFGFEIRAEIADNGTGIGRSHLEIRIPSNVQMETAGCINILRQILGLEYTKTRTRNAKPDNVG